ncbi:hypothetical protein HDU98_001043 [Podochytrium sp. JEL0797]|nr:hypothetical protein HDU98_001043 [Podochytrium sp. JEL0797]
MSGFELTPSTIAFAALTGAAAYLTAKTIFNSTGTSSKNGFRKAGYNWPLIGHTFQVFVPDESVHLRLTDNGTRKAINISILGLDCLSLLDPEFVKLVLVKGFGTFATSLWFPRWATITGPRAVNVVDNPAEHKRFPVLGRKQVKLQISDTLRAMLAATSDPHRPRKAAASMRLNPLAAAWTPPGVPEVLDPLDIRFLPRAAPDTATHSACLTAATTAANSPQPSRAFLCPVSGTPPVNPGRGSFGTPIHCLTNFYGIHVPSSLTVCMYDVRVFPDTVTKVNRRVVDAFRDLLMRNSQSLNLGGWVWNAIYDGSKNLYSPTRLPFTNDEIQCPVDLIDEDAGRKRIQKFIICIKKTSEIQMSTLNLYNAGKLLSNDSSTPSPPREALAVLEVLLRNCPSSYFTTIGRGGGSFYSEIHNTPIANALTVHQGWYQSVKPCFGQVQLNLDVSATSFYSSGPLLDTVAKFFNKPHVDVARPHLVDPHERKRLERFLRDVTIEISYRATGRKRYKIKALFDKPGSQTLIVTGTGEGRVKQIVPLANYFAERYGIELQYPWLPCIVCGTKGDIVLPMEVCFVSRNQRHVGKLNDQQLADIVKLTAVLPEYRKERVLDGMRQLHGTGTLHADPLLASWGVSINQNMSILEARILPPPPLTFGPSPTTITAANRIPYRETITPTDGTWRIGRSLRFASPATLSTWSVAVFGDPTTFPLHVVNAFVTQILSACCAMGMEVCERRMADVVVYAPMVSGGGRMSSETVEATLRVANERAVMKVGGSGGGENVWEFDDLAAGGVGGGRFHAGTSVSGMVGYPGLGGGGYGGCGGNAATGNMAQLVICILAQKNTVYEQVKKVAETDLGLMTQCVIGKHVLTTKPSYSQNLAMKINAKLGGINSFIDPVHELGGLGLVNVPTMIMGADVTHPQYSSADPSSIAAVVGTVDQK